MPHVESIVPHTYNSNFQHEARNVPHHGVLPHDRPPPAPPKASSYDIARHSGFEMTKEQHEQEKRRQFIKLKEYYKYYNKYDPIGTSADKKNDLDIMRIIEQYSSTSVLETTTTTTKTKKSSISCCSNGTDNVADDQNLSNYTYAPDGTVKKKKKGFFASLFGGSDGDERVNVSTTQEIKPGGYDIMWQELFNTYGPPPPSFSRADERIHQQGTPTAHSPQQNFHTPVIGPDDSDIMFLDGNLADHPQQNVGIPSGKPSAMSPIGTNAPPSGVHWSSKQKHSNAQSSPSKLNMGDVHWSGKTHYTGLEVSPVSSPGLTPPPFPTDVMDPGREDSIDSLDGVLADTPPKYNSNNAPSSHTGIHGTPQNSSYHQLPLFQGQATLNDTGDCLDNSTDSLDMFLEDSPVGSAKNSHNIPNSPTYMGSSTHSQLHQQSNANATHGLPNAYAPPPLGSPPANQQQQYMNNNAAYRPQKNQINSVPAPLGSTTIQLQQQQQYMNNNAAYVSQNTYANSAPPPLGSPTNQQQQYMNNNTAYRPQSNLINSVPTPLGTPMRSERKNVSPHRPFLSHQNSTSTLDHSTSSFDDELAFASSSTTPDLAPLGAVSNHTAASLAISSNTHSNVGTYVASSGGVRPKYHDVVTASSPPRLDLSPIRPNYNNFASFITSSNASAHHQHQHKAHHISNPEFSRIHYENVLTASHRPSQPDVEAVTYVNPAGGPNLETSTMVSKHTTPLHSPRRFPHIEAVVEDIDYYL